MHPARLCRTLLRRLFGAWILPAERAVKVAHDITISRRRAQRRPLPRPVSHLTGRPVLRVIQGGKSVRKTA